MSGDVVMRGGREKGSRSTPALIAGAVVAIALAVAIGGCGGSSSSYSAESKPALRGSVMGGTAGNPITGAQVTVYQAGASGNRTGATQLATATTDKDGNFKLSKIACQSGQQVYVVATGGTPAGQSAPNAAIALSAAIGPCGATKHSVTINEVTTIATVWAFNQFTDSTGTNIGAAASNPSALGNAGATLTASSLVDLSTGLMPSVLPFGVDPTFDALNTLADILATCVDSSGASSSECHELFALATPPGGTTPTTTLEVAVDMARSPTNNVIDLFSLIPASPPFTPLLPIAPTAWALGIKYGPAEANFNSPYSLALDAAGNVWVANAGSNTVSELIASEGYISAATFSPAGASLSNPTSVAIDSDGNVWASDYRGDSISELTASSNYEDGLNYAPAGALLNSPLSLALDAQGNVWAANYRGDSVSELTASSAYADGVNFAPSGAEFKKPAAIIVDLSGNIWAANWGNDSVSELTAADSYATGNNFSPSGAALSVPLSLDVDEFGNLWVANSFANHVSELTAASSYTTGLNLAPAGALIQTPYSLYVDSSNNVWVANSKANSISELTAASGYATGINFQPFSNLGSQFEIALDSGGNVWTVNNYDDTVTDLIGVASPVITPIQDCLIAKSDTCTP